MAVIFEHDPSTPVKPTDTDGMQEFMDELDAPSDTDWDISVENPPHAGYTGYMPHPDLVKKPD